MPRYYATSSRLSCLCYPAGPASVWQVVRGRGSRVHGENLVDPAVAGWTIISDAGHAFSAASLAALRRLMVAEIDSRQVPFHRACLAGCIEAIDHPRGIHPAHD